MDKAPKIEVVPEIEVVSETALDIRPTYQRSARQRKVAEWWWILGGVAFLAVLLLVPFVTAVVLLAPSKPTAFRGSGGSVARAEEERRIRSVPLVLLDWHWSSEHGYVIGEGQVRNVSGRKLENVQAVATFFTADGALVTSDNALIEYNPLMPGQVSPFKVMARHNPMMEKAGIAFKTFGGQRLEHINKEDYERIR